MKWKLCTYKFDIFIVYYNYSSADLIFKNLLSPLAIHRGSFGLCGDSLPSSSMFQYANPRGALPSFSKRS